MSLATLTIFFGFAGKVREGCNVFTVPTNFTDRKVFNGPLRSVYDSCTVKVEYKILTHFNTTNGKKYYSNRPLQSGAPFMRRT